MRRTSALLLAILAAGTTAVAAPTPPKGGVDARAEVFDAVAAPKHVSYVGQLSTIRSGSSRAFAVVAKVEHLAPDRTRRTYLAPRSLYGQYVVTQGARSWDVDPRTKRVVVTENRAAADPTGIVDDIALLDTNYRAVRTGADDVAERKTDVVDLVSKRTGERAMRLWLDRDTHIALAREAYHSDGSLAWRTRFDDIRFTERIPAQVFNAAIPSGYATIQGRAYGAPANGNTADRGVSRALAAAGFTAITPKFLPDGFSIVGADVSTSAGMRNLHLVYSDGIRTLSLFETGGDRAIDFGSLKVATISFEGHEARYVRDGPTILLGWRERGHAFALAADLELEELVAIAKSVVP